MNNLISNPGCTSPNNIHTNTRIYSESNVTFLYDLAPENIAGIQLDNNIIMQPKVTKMKTRETFQLLLLKIPEPGRESHQASGIMNNLLSESIIFDAGCELFLYGIGADILYYGEIIIRGW